MTKPPLMIVPKNATALEVLAERYRTAFDKTKAGREQWIEGTLELAAVVAELRERYPAHQEFSRWLEYENLPPMNKDARAALVRLNKMGEKTARELLGQTQQTSWHWIVAKHAQTSLLQMKKGAQRPISSSSGAHWRKRAQRIPDVMREEPSPPAKPPRRLSDMGLTPEQVDPDFKGTPLEFARKYGHVNLHTKDQIERHKQGEALAEWLASLQKFEHAGRMMLGAFSAVNTDTILEWKSKNGKADKLGVWCDSLEIAYEALRKL